MNNFRNAMRVLGDVVVEASSHEKKVNDLADILMRKTWNVDYSQAKAIARVLVNQAEITWK